MKFQPGEFLKQQSKLGIYFHIPFCAHLCPYCDFVKTTRFNPRTIDSFFGALKAQLVEELALIPKSHQFVCVYFGGGTPSLFPSEKYGELLELIAQKFVLEEVTLETNPLTNRSAALKNYFSVGINRLTIGAQSLCHSALKVLGRQHSRQDIRNTLYWSREAGFENIQVDLIYGLAENLRTISIENEILEIVDMGATGISGYGLTLEDRTEFKFRTDLLDEQSCLEEYEVMHDTCVSLGMMHLETSNFSKFDAKHNNIYWHGLPYIGIGTGAHGLVFANESESFGRRYKVGKHLLEFSPGNDDLNFELESHRLFTKDWEPPRSRGQFLDENIFTLLRTPRGIPNALLNEFCSESSIAGLKKNPVMKKALESKFLAWDEVGLSLHWKEKLRGDSWALFISSILNPVNLAEDPNVKGTL